MEKARLWLQRHPRWLKTLAFGSQQFSSGTESQLPAKAFWNIPSGNLASSLERTTTLRNGSNRITELNVIIYFSQYCGPIPSFKSISSLSELFGTLRTTRIGPVYLHDTDLRLALNIKCPVSTHAQEMVGSITIVTTAISTIIKIIVSTAIPP